MHIDTFGLSVEQQRYEPKERGRVCLRFGLGLGLGHSCYFLLFGRDAKLSTGTKPGSQPDTVTLQW